MLDTVIQRVLALDDLRPSSEVNAALGALVEAVTLDARPTITHPYASTIRHVASTAESHLEVEWARRIVGSSCPAQELRAFPYYENYQELVRREIKLIERSGYLLQPQSRVCMIGTGPLPMTALALVDQRGVQIDHVDISPQALALCSLVSGRLGLDCGHIGGDGATVVLDVLYDVVFVAGLAGENLADKQAIIDNALASLAPGGRIVVRSAWGARSLLYPAIAADMLMGVRLLEEYHPHDEVINSVFVYEKA